jgi:hypothetical protein
LCEAAATLSGSCCPMEGDDSPSRTKEELVEDLARLRRERDSYRTIAEQAIEVMTRAQFAEFRRRMDELDELRGL